MRAIIFGLIMCIIFSCAPKPWYINQNYSNEKFTGDSIFVLSISSSDIKPGFLSSKKSIGGKEKSLFIRDFKLNDSVNTEVVYADTFNLYFKNFSNSITKKSVFYSRTLEGKEIETFDFRKVMNAGSDNPIRINFKVPEKTFLESNNIRSRFILIPNDLKLDFVIESAPGGGTSKGLTLFVHYLIWDYLNNREVAYGLATGSVSAKFFTTNKDWYNIINKACKNIIWNTPFNDVSKK